MIKTEIMFHLRKWTKWNIENFFLLRRVFNIGEELNNIESWIYLRVTFSILVIKVLFPN